MRVIKKYPNRRLYDTTLGTYITLDDVRKLVLKRIDFKVIDVNTNKDLTQTTLLQIIIEEESSQTPLFTTPLLQDFIRFYEQQSQPLLTHYLEQMMQLFMQEPLVSPNSSKKKAKIRKSKK